MDQNNLFTKGRAVMLLIDPDSGKIVNANPAAAEFYGYSRPRLTSMLIMDINILSAEEVKVEMANAREERRNHFFFKHRLASGEIRDVLVHSAPIQHKGRTVLFSIIHDITVRKEYEEQLKVFSRIIDQGRISIIVTDPGGFISYTNPFFETVFGIGSRAAHGCALESILFEGADPGRVGDFWRTIKNGGAWEGEVPIVDEAGRERFLEIIASSVENESGSIGNIAILCEDISARKKHQEEIFYHAHYDSLTGLPNRHLTMDRFRHSMIRLAGDSSRTGVIFLDLDNFKYINDTFGHELGDRLLRIVADRLRSSVREIDTVGRLAGDEFIILLESIRDAAEAEKYIEIIRAAFREKFSLEGVEYFLTFSAGITIFPDDSESEIELLKYADAAMYQAKSNGRNSWVFFQKEMNEKMQRRLLLESQLRSALPGEELFVVFQPIFDAAERIVGAEALLRWNNPVLGSVSPADFIPVAEETGLILPITQFVVRAAAVFAHRIQESFGAGIPVSVNFSIRDFFSENFVNEVAGAFNSRGQFLRMEVTESLLIHNPERMKAVMLELKSRGYKLLIDDFGTGYSSLSYLHTFPFDTLKIDRSFVARLAPDSDINSLVQAILTMAGGLGLGVVAEGVETTEQKEILLAMGCEYFQGFFFSKPLAIDDFFELVRAALKR